MIVDHELGLTHLGRCGLPPVRLVVENTRSWEWISLPRREPRRARERLGPLRTARAALAPSKLHPLLQARLLLSLRKILVQAMLGAKLLIRRPLPDKAEAAVTNFTARLRWAAFVLRLFARHLHFLNLTGFIRSSQAT